MKASTVFDCLEVDLNQQHDIMGNSLIIEKTNNCTFDLKRIYYIYNVPAGQERGRHAHKILQQLIIAVCGSFDLIVDDGKAKKKFKLNSPTKGIQMPSGLWRELKNFSTDSVCLVICSNEYDESDYIRNYQDFLNFKLDKQ